MSAPTLRVGAELVVYLAKRFLQTDREDQPYLFEDRLNDLVIAVREYELSHGQITTDIPEADNWPNDVVEDGAR